MGLSQAVQWKPPIDLYIIMDYKYCKVWVRKTDKVEHLQEYRVQINDRQQLDRYQNMFVLRIEQQYFPLAVYFINQSNLSICGAFKQGSILIQRIPYRLCQFSNLQYSQAISILSISLRGYQKLYQKYGMFKVKSTMIGFNRNYQLKIWCHTDLSNPQPEDPYCNSLVQMINSIVKSIQNVSSYPYNLNRFSQYLEIKKISLFSFELSFKILQQYILENRFKIRNTFENIGRFITQAQGRVSSSNFREQSYTEKRQNFSKNKTRQKHSLKKNQISQSKEKYINQQLPQNLYYRNNNFAIQPLRFVKSSQKVRQFASNVSSPQSNLRKLKSKEKLDNRQYKQDVVSFEQYEINRNVMTKGKPYNHTRTASKAQRPLKQQENLRQSQIYVPYTHARIASDLTLAKKAPKFASIYYDHTETKSRTDSSSLQSFKSIDSLESYSMLKDSQVRRDLVSMMRTANRNAMLL